MPREPTIYRLYISAISTYKYRLVDYIEFESIIVIRVIKITIRWKQYLKNVVNKVSLCNKLLIDIICKVAQYKILYKYYIIDIFVT